MKIEVVEKLSSFKLINSEEMFYTMPCNGPFQQVTVLLKHAANPSQDHLNKVLYIGHYLLGTQSAYIKYDGSTDKGITVCTDSDWGLDSTACKSVMGYFLKLTNGIFSWTLCT